VSAIFQQVLIVRYAEIGLKGKNRHWFEKQLCRNIQAVLPGCKVKRTDGRIVVHLENSQRADISRVFGISSWSPAYMVKNDISQIKLAVKATLENIRERGSFRITTKRSWKEFHLSSQQVNEILGEFVVKHYNLKVDLKNWDINITVEIGRDNAFVSAVKYRGLGGLPVGTSSKALLLLSAGIDSPVAGWYCLKRGIQLYTISFLSPPYTGERSAKKISDICRVLSKYSPGITLQSYLINFTQIQQRIKELPEDSYSLILQRRSMIRIACKLAEKMNIKALYTGESIGQVASQTVENIHTIDEASSLPIMRPLIGFDKQEIISKAKEIGTFEISIEPYLDSCVIFAPRKPVIRSDISVAKRLESKIPDIEELESRALENAQQKTYADGDIVVS